MNFIYTLAKPNPLNTFVIHIDYEHGDADLTTTEKHSYQFPKEELPDFVQAVEKIADQIENNRSYGVELPDEFEEQAAYKDHQIPLNRDQIYDNSGQFASMSIDKIEYFDENGVKYDVKPQY